VLVGVLVLEGVWVGVVIQNIESNIQFAESINLIKKLSSAEGDGTIKVYGKKVTPLWTNCGTKSV
jgi:hypothetical protein